MQTSLPLDLKKRAPQKIALNDAAVFYYPHFIDAAESKLCFNRLRDETSWRQDSLNFGGKTVLIPRLQAWYGDKDAAYAYSGLALSPNPWTPILLKLKILVEKAADTHFNSVLLNYYRDGKDSVAWHSDDEKELGENPVIASLSLGITRRFELRHRKRDVPKSVFELENGSLLLMGPGIQENWHHQVPKQPGLIGERINLTFRKIYS